MNIVTAAAATIAITVLPCQHSSDAICHATHLMECAMIETDDLSEIMRSMKIEGFNVHGTTAYGM